MRGKQSQGHWATAKTPLVIAAHKYPLSKEWARRIFARSTLMFTIPGQGTVKSVDLITQEAEMAFFFFFCAQWNGQHELEAAATNTTGQRFVGLKSPQGFLQTTSIVILMHGNLNWPPARTSQTTGVVDKHQENMCRIKWSHEIQAQDVQHTMNGNMNRQGQVSPMIPMDAVPLTVVFYFLF